MSDWNSWENDPWSDTPKTDSEEKQIRKFAISVAKKKKSAYKAIQKYYGDSSTRAALPFS